jgi:hypothetical protein
LCALAALISMNAHAAGLMPDQLSLAYAEDRDLTFYDIGLVWALPTRWDATLNKYDLSLRLSADVTYWRSDESAPTTMLWDFNVTPLLRWSPPGNGLRVFVEGGIGVHLLTHVNIGNARDMTTAFQFGERAAVGLAFGPGEKWEIAGYAQHVSNGDIKKPNDGATQYGVMARIPLD